MSVGKREMAPPERQQQGEISGGAVAAVAQKEEEEEEAMAAAEGSAPPRYARCFSGLEFSVGPGPLRDADDGKLKRQIRRWAKAVVAFARQISFGGGGGGCSPRARSRSASSHGRAMSRRGDGDGDGDTPRYTTFRSKSGHRDADNDDPGAAPCEACTRPSRAPLSTL